MTELELDDVRVDEHTEGVVTIAYSASASHGGDARYDTLASSVYVRVRDAWKLTLHQQTPIA